MGSVSMSSFDRSFPRDGNAHPTAVWTASPHRDQAEEGIISQYWGKGGMLSFSVRVLERILKIYPRNFFKGKIKRKKKSKEKKAKKWSGEGCGRGE